MYSGSPVQHAASAVSTAGVGLGGVASNGEPGGRAEKSLAEKRTLYIKTRHLIHSSLSPIALVKSPLSREASACEL